MKVTYDYNELPIEELEKRLEMDCGSNTGNAACCW